MINPTGFWSYTSSDDTSSRGRLSQLRSLLAAEFQQQVGRRPRVNVFQDVAAIPPGEAWERQIRLAIEQSTFIIPIVTPAFLQSEWCCQEIRLFSRRADSLGSTNSIFPIHYVDTDHIRLDDDDLCQDGEILRLLRTRQWADFRGLRFRHHDSEEVAQFLERLARSILAVIRRVQSDTPPPAAIAPAEAVAGEIPPGIAAPTGEVVTVEPRPVLQVAGSATWDEGFDSMRRLFDRLDESLAALDVAAAGPPMALFTHTSAEDFRYVAMIPVAAVPERPAAALPNGIAFGRSLGGTVVRFRYDGAYDDIDGAYEALTAEIDRQGLAVQDRFAETFLRRVETTEDASLRMEIDVWLA